MAPAMQLLDFLGYEAKWDEKGKELTAVKPNLNLKFTLHAATAFINDISYTMPKEAVIIDNTLYIPLRFTAVHNNKNVLWNSKNNVVLIESIASSLPLRLMVPATDQLNENNKQPLVDYLNNNLNNDSLNLDLMALSKDNYREKMMVMIAAGDPAHLTYMPDVSLFTPDILESFAIDLEQYVASYPLLQKQTSEAASELKGILRKNLTLPKTAPTIDGVFPVINQNWLDILGLAEPTTIDELYTVLKLFSENDPDGNGKKDDYGLTGYIYDNTLGSLAWVEHVFTGAVSRYELKDGKLIDYVLSTDTRDALLWLNKLYTEGLLDPEFAVRTPEAALQAFQHNKFGVTAMKLQDAANAELAMKHPLTPLVSLKSSAGRQAVTAQQSAFDGAYYMSKFSRKEQIDGALTLMEKLHELAEDKTEDTVLRIAARELVGSNEVILDHASQATKKRYNEIVASRKQIPTKPLYEQQLYTGLDNKQRAILSELNSEILKQKVKVIMGASSIDEWDQFIKNLQQSEDYKTITKLL